MRFLIITQDLRVSGTSQGIIERSFLSKLRKLYPDAIIDVLYICTHTYDDSLDVLPVNSINKKIVNTKIPFHIKWMNRISRRLFNSLLAENYIHKQYAKEIKKVDYTMYNHIMVRSAGLDYETVLAMHNLPILKYSIVNFHDPYPYAWYKGKAERITPNEFKRLQKVIEIVKDAKICCASAYYMAKDLQYLYASDKYFYTLPHQFAFDGFDLSDNTNVRKKNKKIQISYHGALMFGRNVFTIVEAFKQLMEEHEWIKKDVEFVLRVKGDGVNKLKEFVKDVDNILVLDTLNFSNSSNEQIYESDINIILENGPHYCNILGGKVPFLFAINKKVFISSPERSELRRYLPNHPFLCDMNDLEDTKSKLHKALTLGELHNLTAKKLFSDENFKKQLDVILQEKLI
ncbi:hypothetical protein [Flavobacterium sp.]|uniref:hypothetical protein n=1 Tax=Flavobacterium sp. TaxID=239 RepID=UPI003D0D8A57